jgi:hypothetical protein
VGGLGVKKSVFLLFFVCFSLPVFLCKKRKKTKARREKNTNTQTQTHTHTRPIKDKGFRILSGILGGDEKNSYAQREARRERREKRDNREKKEKHTNTHEAGTNKIHEKREERRTHKHSQTHTRPIKDKGVRVQSRTRGVDKQIFAHMTRRGKREERVRERKKQKEHSQTHRHTHTHKHTHVQ